AGDDVRDQPLLMLFRADLLDQPTSNNNRLDERLHDEMPAKLLRDQHRRKRAAAKAAGSFGKRRAQQAEFGKGLPLLAAEAFFIGEDPAAGIETILVAQQA